MGRVSDASAIYLGTVAADKIYLGAAEIWAPSSGSDPAYGTGVYGPPLDFTTTGAPGPFVIVDSRKRVSVVYEQLETDPYNVGYPYRIDFDVIAADGTILHLDWCDMSPTFDQVVVAGQHYGHESVGRVGGYSTTYRFMDFQCDVGGTVTIDNIMVRRIFEFSS